eukprot:4578881-Prymnesium_polylepis.1
MEEVGNTYIADSSAKMPPPAAAALATMAVAAIESTGESTSVPPVSTSFDANASGGQISKCEPVCQQSPSTFNGQIDTALEKQSTTPAGRCAIEHDGRVDHARRLNA